MKDWEKQEVSGGGNGEIAIPSNRFLRWLDNYWYHYKWPTIGIAFALIVVTICMFQTCSKESYDVKMVYAGPAVLTNEEVASLDQLMDLTVPRDFNEDGEKNASLLRHSIYSEEQIKEAEEQLKGETEKYIFDRQYNANEYDSYYNEIMAGTAAIYFLDPWLYEELKHNKSGDYLRRLDDLFDTLPEGALDDGFGVRLGDTDLYKKYKVLSVLPEDTVVCMLTRLVNHKERMYAQSEEMFRALVG